MYGSVVNSLAETLFNGCFEADILTPEVQIPINFNFIDNLGIHCLFTSKVHNYMRNILSRNPPTC